MGATGHIPAIVLCCLQGCVPFAVPPVRAELGGIWRKPDVASTSGADETDVQPAAAQDNPPMIARVAAHPLQALPKLRGRWLDVGAGYLAEGSNDGRDASWRHGPYAELGLYPLRASIGSGRRARAGVLVMGEYFVHDDAGLTAGTTVAATVELTGFARGGFETRDAVGLAYGEWGIGLFAGPSVRFNGERSSWLGAFGLTARIPLVLGVACCADVSEVLESRTRHRRSSHSHEARREDRRSRHNRRDHQTHGGARHRKGRAERRHRRHPD